MTNKEAIEVLNYSYGYEFSDRVTEALDLAIKALENQDSTKVNQESNQGDLKGDLISREALKTQVKELLDMAIRRVDDTPNTSPCFRMYVAQEDERARLLELIDNAPTVDKGYQEGHIDGVLQAEKLYARPRGEWIMNKTSPRGRNYTCTICKNKSRNNFHYCPNCGADMREER